MLQKQDFAGIVMRHRKLGGETQKDIIIPQDQALYHQSFKGGLAGTPSYQTSKKSTDQPHISGVLKRIVGNGGTVGMPLQNKQTMESIEEEDET
jgi:hypothetical protein